MRIWLGGAGLLLALSACNADGPQIRQVGGGVLDVSRAEGMQLLHAAEDYCAKRGAQWVARPVSLQPGDANAQDATHWGSRAAHLQFRCVSQPDQASAGQGEADQDSA
ncbi:hypothetical protein [Pseudoxanthomonas composti]|uniref:DUF4156 domain-containing protein n=1 Tax=Pseudoxanthomonas composti TaxID=2137479 RepID=A0A4Q1JRB9_9GAMM|nr:hypothetical protein [Pseudoxanthomonas composti]RXR00334.1 hypothetical protein EPA99_17150 [Pseudoxanthomonas composti]